MSKRVLVVDDSRFVCEQMKKMMEDTEFTVAGYCMTGEEVLNSYDEVQPDVVTMDIILPGMDGLEASEKLLEVHPDARIIVVSSLAYDETEEKAAELGIQHFLFKPYEKDTLLDALRQVV